MRIIRIVLFVTLSAFTASAQTTNWKLVWSDEFNDPAGTPPDPAKWNFDLGGGGWGNGEAEIYTNSPNNVFQDGHGNLVIRAIRDASGNYTSARLQTGSPGASTHTADLSWQYGRIQARIKLPFGKGVWPAFWMLGENIGSVSWPTCGEVDIMEKVADDYHVYAIEWSPDSVEWLVDGASYHKVTPASLPAGRQWVFNNKFFVLLNLAIGGPTTFLGRPDPNASFPPQDMLVDYVRVYQAVTSDPATPGIIPGRILNAASFLGSIAPGGLAVLYGQNLADDVYPVSATRGFPTSVGGVTVNVNGVFAPLIFLSPTQINFQVPWETVPGTAVNVTVTRNGVDSNVEPITIASTTSPSLFLNEYTNGVVWVTGTGCETVECTVQAGAEYVLWGNGFGPKNSPLQDGLPATYSGSLTPLEVPGGPASCQLTIGGQTARVDYCGAAPGLIIEQLNFEYPSSVSTASPYVDATLAINGVTGRFRVPAPRMSMTTSLPQ